MNPITRIEVTKPGRYYVYAGLDQEGNTVSTYESENWSAHADAISMFICEGHSINLQF